MLETVQIPALFLVIACFCAYLSISRRPCPLPIPPDPRPLPLLGNILFIPSRKPWETYAKWARQYKSDIVSVHTFGQMTVVVNTIEAAKEMFQRRSTIYSDRPRMPMIDLMEWDFNTGLMPYSSAWRVRRKMLHQFLHSRAAIQYRPMQKKYSRELMRLLCLTPENFIAHLRHYASSIVMSMAYAHDLSQSEDRYLDIAEQAVGMLSGSVFPGAMLVNALPILRHLPDWLPGTGFKAYAEKCALLTREMRQRPFEAVKRSRIDGSARPSILATLLEVDEADEETIMDVGAIIYATGADTTVSTLITAILALVLHPDVRYRAQTEIDTVVGRERLPDFEDPLPYVGAVCREISRWKPVTPLGVAHSAYDDDVYKGWGIPKGTHIIMNTWAILHDPVKYPDPESFKPERFLTDDGTLNDDNVQAGFGFGRRVCIGQHLASATLWFMVAHTLALYDIKRAKNDTGLDIPIHVEYTDGLVSHALLFRCSFSPRDQKAERLIREA